MTIKHFMLAALATITVMPGAAFAHGNASPSHGGIMAVSGETQIEAVRTPSGLDLYVSEEGLPLVAADLGGHASIKDAAGNPVTLTPQDGNRLQATGLSPQPGQSVMVMIEQKASALRSFATYQF